MAAGDHLTLWIEKGQSKTISVLLWTNAEKFIKEMVFNLKF